MTPSRIAASVPELPADAVAALPPRRPLALRVGAALLAGTATAGLMFFLWPHPAGSDHDALRSSFSLVPWFLGLPWLKRLDIRPVLWFFASILCSVLVPLLAGRIVYRALSLPYRDWEIADWNRDRCRVVRVERAIVLLPDDQVVARSSPGEAVWRQVLRVGWTVVIVLFLGLAVAEAGGVRGAVADSLHAAWLAIALSVGLVQLVGEFLLGRAEGRAAGTS